MTGVGPSVVNAVACAVSIQKLMVERNTDTPETKRIVYRVGVNLGDVLIQGDDILCGGAEGCTRRQFRCHRSAHAWLGLGEVDTTND